MDMEDLKHFSLGEMDLINHEPDFFAVRDVIDCMQEDEELWQQIELGTDLESLLDSVRSQLEVTQKEAVEDYVRVGEDVADLHEDIRECDKVLGRMEEKLGGFQDDLRNIGEEIRVLQDRSYQMNVMLRNRKSVFDEIARFAQNVVVTPELMEQICERDVDDRYLGPLLDLESKLDLMYDSAGGATTQQLGIRHCRAIEEMRPFLEKLQENATSKVRNFLLESIYQLKRERSNIQVHQQSTLIRFKFFFKFLHKFGKDAAEEVCRTYIDTLSKLYFANFKSYMKSLMALKIDVAGKNDVLGAKDSSSAVGVAVRVYSLGSRVHALYNTEGYDDIITRLEEAHEGGTVTGGGGVSSSASSSSLSGKLVDSAPRGSMDLYRRAPPDQEIIVPYTARLEKKRYYFEQIFRSFHCMYLDTCTSEHIFLADFFGSNKPFDAIFLSTNEYVTEVISDYVNGSHDSVGIMLLLRLIHHFHSLARKRGIQHLDGYFDGIKSAVWPQLHVILDNHCRSLASSPTDSSGGIHPHYITRRFAELSASLHTINMRDINDLSPTLAQLRNQMESFLQRVCQASFQHPKEKIVFLINNYDMIVRIYEDRHVDAEDHIRMQELLKSNMHKFVDLTMDASFRGLLDTMRSMESVLVLDVSNRAGPSMDAIRQENRGKIDERALENAVRRFEETWKGGITSLNEEVLVLFSNFRTGLDVLKQVLTSLLLLNTRLNKIVDACYANPPFRTAIVSNNVIMFEVKNLNKDL